MPVSRVIGNFCPCDAAGSREPGEESMDTNRMSETIVFADMNYNLFYTVAKIALCQYPLCPIVMRPYAFVPHSSLSWGGLLLLRGLFRQVACRRLLQRR